MIINITYGDCMDFILDKKIIYFMTVVEEGSFSAAARKLYLSQPAISQYMELLEKESGLVLFDRKGYRAIPTEQGKTLYDGCKKIHQDVSTLEKELFKNNKIRIGFTRSNSNQRLLKLISTLFNKYPNIRFDLYEDSFQENTLKLLNNEIDLSFGLECDFKNQSDISFIRLYPFDLCVICSYEHPFSNKSKITPTDLINEKFILLSKKYSINNYHEMMESFHEDKINPRIEKEVDSFDELIYSIAANQGIGIVSRDVVSKDDVCVIPLCNSHHKSIFSVGYRNDCLKIIPELILEIQKYYTTP